MIRPLYFISLLLLVSTALADTRIPDRTFTDSGFLAGVECENGGDTRWFLGGCIAPYTPVAASNTEPVITLTGAASVSYTVDDTYNELDATCTDAEDGSIIVPAPSFAPTLDMSSAGTYIATYTCTDSESLTDQATRTVNVNAPVSQGTLAFTNATTSIDQSPDITQVFWAGMPDVNGDGCLDLYIGAHSDDVNSAMLIQDNSSGTCQGTFTYFADADNYSQASPTTPRITSRYTWGNWYGHPEGFWSFYGGDVDGSASAEYVLDPNFTTVGGQPQYLTKTTGCFGAQPKCLIADIDGGGDFEMVSKLYAAPYNTGYVVDLDDGSTIYAPTSMSNTFSDALTVFDLDNDGYPEIFHPGEGGYFDFNPSNSTLNWVSGGFTALSNSGDKDNIVLDYDNDGDLDFWWVDAAYNTSGTGTIYLLSNDGDGTFTDVSSTAFAGVTIDYTAYHSSYANTVVADINNDGYPDILYAAENYDTIVTFLINDGDGTFTKDDSHDLDPVGFGGNSDRAWINTGDYDNDGKIDIVHNGAQGSGAVQQGQLWRNTSNNTNHWIRTRVRGEGGNTDGLHSRITYFEAGTSNIISYQHIGVFSHGYHNMRAHSGLGSHTTIDVRVEYPHGGPTCNFSNVAADQDYIVFRSCNIQSYTPGSAIPLTASVASNDDLVFADVSTTAIDSLQTVNTRFWAGMPDLNGDGCFDIFVGTHSDNIDSAAYIQNNSGGCQGTFTYLANSNNYTQASPVSPRITGRYAFGNWTGDTKGLWSFWGTDVDGNAAALYEIDGSTTVGGNPTYLSKSSLCNSVSRCWAIDSNGDGNIELVHSDRDLVNLREIKDVQTGAVIHTVNNTGGDYHHLVFDTNNDTYPDIVNVATGSIWRYNSGTSQFDLITSTHTVNGSATPNHSLTLDYDNDGDTDFMTMDGFWESDGVAQWHLHRNDGGTFTEVTTGSGLDTMNFHNEDYWTIYANAFVSDMNLDGYPDILFSGSEYGRDLHIILNDGDGTFTKWDDQDFGGGGGSGGKAWVYGRDYDNDGDIDLIKADDANGSLRLWRNDISTANNWLRIRAVGLGDNTDGLHTRINIRNPSGNAIISSYEIQHQQGNAGLIPHVGVGTLTSVNVEVIWPHNGGTQTHTNVAVDQDIIVYRTGQYATYTPGSAIPLTYVATNDVNTNVTLIADSGITPTSTELVTFGLPFAQGEVTNLSEITVDIAGVEQAVFVEEGLTWWTDNSVRSATIQLQNVDMTSGNVVVNVTDEGSTVARLTKQTVTNGWADIVGATKDNHLSPRILPQHDTQYLADSGLIPPYNPDPVTPDSYALYRDDMFDDWQGTPLDYSATSGANWLFDKASAHFKGYMSSGDITYLAEAARAKQFYFTHVRNDGTAPTAAGGDGCWTYGGTACADGKYIYPQPAKLALALLGDNSQWDDSLINEMAEQAQLGWNQFWYAFPYDTENDGYTERSHGLIALAITNAYEITGDAGVLADLAQAIDYTRDMQQTTFSWDTINSWANMGCFRHSWDVHEGGPGNYPGDGVTDDRRCSPWMSENVADFLWQAYWSVPNLSNRGDIGEILRRLGEAVESYAYNTSTLEPSAPQVGIQEACGNACTTMSFCTAGNTPVVFYSMSNVASTAAIRATAEGNGRTDTHIPEMVLIHAAARYFETDVTINAAHDARIARVNPDYYQIACADWYTGTGTERLYQWQLRGNAQRTWDWIEGEV